MNKPDTVTCIAVAGLAFVFSLVIAPYYVNGDQFHYIRVYEELVKLDFLDGFEYYKKALTSQEVVHFTLSWVACKYLEKTVFVALSNSLLAYLATAVFIRWRAAPWLASTIVLSNFYFVVLYFAAERLKFGFVFLAASILCLNRRRWLFLFSFLSVASHVQVVIAYASILFRFFVVKIRRFLMVGRVHPLYVLSFAIIIPITLFPFGDQLLRKLEGYSHDQELASLGRSLAFLLLSIYYSRNRSDVILLFIPILVAAYVVGDERVNLLAYFVFLYYGFRINHGINAGVLIVSTYFSYASIPFLAKVLEYGNGFY
jgi:hypothetical protein